MTDEGGEGAFHEPGIRYRPGSKGRQVVSTLLQVGHGMPEVADDEAASPPRGPGKK